MNAIDTKIVVFKEPMLDLHSQMSGVISEHEYPIETAFIKRTIIRIKGNLYEVMDSFIGGVRNNVQVETVYISQIYL